MSLIQRELPIKIVFSSDVQRPKKINQPIKRVTIEGPREIVPEVLVLDADEIATGGMLMIEDMALPADCYVVDRRGSDPVVMVEKQKVNKRAGKDKRSEHDDYDED
jgi:hypothetical protein